MKSYKIHLFRIATGLFFVFAQSCRGQTESGRQFLRLEKEIALPNVKGRIDHIDINVKEQVAYVAALGNNTLEIADLT